MKGKKKGSTKKSEKVIDYKGTARIVTIAPTKKQVEDDWARSNRHTKFSLIFGPKKFQRITTRTPKLR